MDRIPAAEKFTNAWLFDRTKTNFVDWLESGSGIYWITGKVRSPGVFSIKDKELLANIGQLTQAIGGERKVNHGEV